MKITVHYPTANKEIFSLQQKVAKIHVQAVANFLQNLNCPKEQKLRLLNDIKDTK